MPRAKPPRRQSSTLDDLPFHLPRVYYAFLGLVERRLQRSGLDAHLRPGMGTILFALYEEDDCILKDLVRRTRLAHNTLSGLLRRMESAGLVTCSTCRDDARATRIRLTPLGRSLQPELKRFHLDLVAVLERDLSAAESGKLRHLLGRVLESIRADEAAGAGPRQSSRSAARARKGRNRKTRLASAG